MEKRIYMGYFFDSYVFETYFGVIFFRKNDDKNVALFQILKWSSSLGYEYASLLSVEDEVNEHVKRYSSVKDVDIRYC